MAGLEVKFTLICRIPTMMGFSDIRWNTHALRETTFLPTNNTLTLSRLVVMGFGHTLAYTAKLSFLFVLVINDSLIKHYC